MSKLLKLVGTKPFDFTNALKYATAPRIIDKPVCYVDGQWVSGSASELIAVDDPCTGDVIGEVPMLNRTETEEAIIAAQIAFESWKQVLPRERGILLKRWADLMLQHQEVLGTILSRESGKVIAEGIGEVIYAERFIEWFAGEAVRIYGNLIPPSRANVQAMVLKQPVGVVGIITPWNFPSSMITRGAAAALAAGCTVVVKPASATPFSALALAQLAQDAGIPAGVFNVVTGASNVIAPTLLDNFAIRKIAFTGSTNVGKELYAKSSATMKKVSMELGGNAPVIVFNDADLTRAVDGVIFAKFRNAGQTCICCNRVLVQSKIHDAFVEALVAKVSQMKVGNNFDKENQMGALINADALKHVHELVQDAVSKGATVMCGGHKVEGKGHFYKPTVLTNVNHDSARCCREEIFGPVIPIVKFTTDDEAIALANDTKAGLASYFFTQDYRKQFRVARELQYGIVGVNEAALSDPMCPFGGVKESGIGRDGSKYAIEQYVDIKYVLMSTVERYKREERY